MNSTIVRALLIGIATGACHAADPVRLPERSRLHLEVGPSWWFGTEVRYGAGAAQDPALTPRTNRTYDDGFNFVDASGNLGDGAVGPLASRTGNFGYISDSQVNVSAGTLALNSLQAAPGNYLGARRPESRPGFGAALRWSLARPDKQRDWGVEVALDWHRLKESSSGPVAANLRVLTDRYPLGGVIPQRAPYTGRFSPLPGDQRIGDMPTRTVANVTGTADGRRSFRARTWAARVGPWVELLPERAATSGRERDRWSLLGRAGLGLLMTEASFAIDERIQAPGVSASPRITAAASRRREDLTWFAGIRGRRVVNERWALLVWADYLDGSNLTVANGLRHATFDTRNSFLAGVALEFRGRKAR